MGGCDGGAHSHTAQGTIVWKGLAKGDMSLRPGGHVS